MENEITIILRYPKDAPLSEIVDDMEVINRRLRMLPDGTYEAVKTPWAPYRSRALSSLLKPQAG